MSLLQPVAAPPTDLPRWITPTLRFSKGDPLGMQTITQDRILPNLVPGVLALSRRARYLSFFCFLLHQYQIRRLPRTNNALGEYLRKREFEYAAAVSLCPRCRDSPLPSRAVGTDSAAPQVRSGSEFIRRDYSIDYELGGYGQQYRSLMTALHLVAQANRASTGNGLPLTADAVLPGRGLALAELFARRVQGTVYIRQDMHGTAETIALQHLEEFAECACLCRLDAPEAAEERDLLRQALLEPDGQQSAKAVEQRRRDMALLLRLLADNPAVAADDAVYRSALWQARPQPGAEPTPRAEVAAQWAALVAKEYYQEAIASAWADFCRAGEQADDGQGLDAAALGALLERLIPEGILRTPDGDVYVQRELATHDLMEMLEMCCGDRSLEELRAWTDDRQSALSGLALLLMLRRRVPDAEAMPQGWHVVARQRSDHQRGLLSALRMLDEHLDQQPTVAQSVAWLVQNFVLGPHQEIAHERMRNGYFAFRFRQVQDRLYFSAHDEERFILANNRREPLYRLAEDVGLWERTADGGAHLTESGRRLAEEV